MVAITTEQRDLAAIRLGFEIFVQPNRVARFGTTSLKGIIDKVDLVMTTIASSLPQSVNVESTLITQMQLVEADLSIAEGSKAIEAWVIEKHGPASV